MVGGWIIYCMIHHEDPDSFPWYVFGKVWIAKEWLPVLVMLTWCVLLWKRERLYAYAGLVWAFIGFVYGFTPYLIRN